MSTVETEGLPPLKVYWQPGCSSCLKTKEYLLEHRVAFESINVLEDEAGFRELEKFGLRMVPIVARGERWANGAVFRDVAAVAGFDHTELAMLDADDLKDKVLMVLAAARRYLVQIPEPTLDDLLPGRPRSYRQLIFHVFSIPDVFLDHVEHGTPYTYEALSSVLPDAMARKDDLLGYADQVAERWSQWWTRQGQSTDFTQPAQVYYGEVSLHEVLERTGWHAGQHTRQIILLLREKLGIEPDTPLQDSDFEGLPIPANVWDNERSFDENAWKGAAES